MTGTDISPISSPLAEKIGEGDGNLQVKRSTEIDLQIHAEPEKTATARRHLEDLGGGVDGSYDEMLWATLEAGTISTYAHRDGIRKVEEHADPIAHSTSEGVAITNADDLHSLGHKGNGITVAVIDLLFEKDQAEISDQVIGTIGDSSYYNDNSSAHGTACAEIVAEMAPEANLVLASAHVASFPNLMDEITLQFEPEVMSMSLGYKPDIRLDGQDYLSDRIIEYSSGSGSNTTTPGLFAVSAGNEANGSHWDGDWTDTSGNGYMEFDDTGTELFEISNPTSSAEVIVHSDADWSTDQGYSLELYDSSQSFVKAPARTTTPAQAISLIDDHTAYLKIEDESLDGTEHFDIFTWRGPLDFHFPDYTATRSIAIPATSPDANTLTVGAVQHDTDELESFSSRGPTQDGRRGVDITGPDGTQSDTYSGEFYGTSASCPHIAGGCALLFEAAGGPNNDIREAVYDSARDVAGDEQGGLNPPGDTNTEIGFGHLECKAAYDLLQQSLSVSMPNESASQGSQVTFSVTAYDVDSVTIEDLWVDWTVASFDSDGGSFTDDLSSSGSVTFSWGNTQVKAAPTVTIDLPSRYIGGEFGLDVSGSGPSGSASAAAVLTIN
jgi:hypothetical protein